MKFFMNSGLHPMMESDLKPVIQYSHEHLDPFSVVFLYSNRIGFIPLSDPTSRIYRGICTRNSIYLFFILIPLNFNPIETDSFNFIFYFFQNMRDFEIFDIQKVSLIWHILLNSFAINQVFGFDELVSLMLFSPDKINGPHLDDFSHFSHWSEH